MDDATLAALRTAAGAVFDLGFATMVGALAALALLHDAPSDRATPCARGVAAACSRSRALVALAASLAWMEVQAIALTELSPGAALLAAGDVVVDTQSGRAWLPGVLALLACIALVAASAPGRGRRSLGWRWPSRGVAAAHARAGHAGANGWGWSTAIMTLHLLAIGAWAGTVFAAALVVLRDDAHAANGARFAARLSTLAGAALAGVVVTGALSAWHGLGGTLAPLVPGTATPWGLALDVKLALVATAIALGGYNRVVVLPALRATPAAPAPWRRFTRVLRLEAVVLLAALVAAALLANGEPPAV